MGEGTALVLVISPDAELRRQIAERIRSDRAVVVTSASLELAGPLLPQLSVGAVAEAAPPDDGDPPVPAAMTTSWPPELQIDRRRMQVLHAGVKVALTPHEYELLALMATDPDKVWRQDDLHLAVWRTQPVGDLGDLHAAVKRLRRKLRAASVPLRIQALRGFGYRLLTDAETAD